MRKNEGSATIEAVIITQLLIFCILLLLYMGFYFYRLAMDRAYQDSVAVRISASWNTTAEPLYWRLRSRGFEKRFMEFDEISTDSTIEAGLLGYDATVHMASESAIPAALMALVAYMPFTDIKEDYPGSCALLGDNAEFIRNTDLVCELLSDIANHPLIKESKQKFMALGDRIRSMIDDDAVFEKQ